MMILPPQVNMALEMLHEAGYEGYLVGGAVRDYARGCVKAKDWDITTNARPEQVEEVFVAFRVIETGLKHGTVTVMIDGEPIEITTYRIDGEYSDHRRPDSVSFTRSLRDDLERRDFTMNALAYAPSEGIVDLIGGLEDLQANLIRCVGDPDRRFQEDALRILRAIRFASVYNMKIEAETAAAMHRNKELLSMIAPERITAELTKTLCGPNVAVVLKDYADIVSIPLPELTAMFGFEQHNPHHDKDVWSHTLAVVSAVEATPVLRWAALLHDMGKPHTFTMADNGVGHFYGHAEQSTSLADEIMRRLRFDTDSRERILTLVRYHDLPIANERKQIRRLLSKLGEEGFRALVELHRADTLGQSSICMDRLDTFKSVEQTLEEILREESCFSLKDLTVNGRDMMELGLSGPQIGRALNECLNAVLEEKVPNSKPELISYTSKFLTTS